MSKNLVIVESPAKAKTIGKYLGSDYEVMASYGHVRDLVPKEGAVDTDSFDMKYEVIDKNKKHVDAIGRAMKRADALFLATDPDREGEAISWHVHELLQEKNLLKNKEVHRVIFHEITKRAIRDAMDHPRKLSTNLINAQQARRALDYLVGFNLSPLLWRKVKRGLSAGRVQSPALRMIVERELEIEQFEKREYWTLEADALKESSPFTAKLTHYQGAKLSQFSVVNSERAGELKQALIDAAAGQLRVKKIEKKQRKRNPTAPFTTSTLQQEASRKLGFSAQRTMRIAQQLYEGIDVGSGSVGLITYMRTDSVTLSKDAIAEIRSFIQNRYGSAALPENPQVYKTKAKNAQEAHEAIRPTSVDRVPEEIKAYLSPEQMKLYEIIWKRSVASQMIHATLSTTSVDLEGGEGNIYRVSGTTIVDAGFLKVYEEGVDDAAKSDGDDKILPPLKEGEVVALKEIRAEQHFTSPPPRFTEATLVKTLEEFGIGRPSTYAAIISTLQARGYAELESRRFVPSDIGKIVNKFLTEHFDRYVDYDFTAKLEDELDAVSRGDSEWKPLMRGFWENFHTRVDSKMNVSRAEVLQARELGTDPKSGRPVSVRLGRYGPMVQIGTREDEEKPLFAGLRSDQRMDSITLDDALELFKLPRKLGETPEGEPVSANIGRFGPYVQYGKKFASIKEDDPHTITLERALEVVAAKKEADANKLIAAFDGSDIQILRGRYGPYISNGKKNARIPKDVEPEKLTLAECEELIAKAPDKKARRGRGKAKS